MGNTAFEFKFEQRIVSEILESRRGFGTLKNDKRKKVFPTLAFWAFCKCLMPMYLQVIKIPWGKKSTCFVNFFAGSARDRHG